MIVIFAALKKKLKKVSVSDKSNKEQIILQAAQKRFGMLGIEKTSMQEIADDLNISKASLYYYYPDKESLYKAVIEKEQNEFVNMLTEKVLSIDEPDKLLREYVNARLSYFRSLLNLSRLRLDTYSELRPVFKETIIAFKEKEKEIVKKIFNDGIMKGIFTLEDSDSAALLFLNLLKGLRISVVNEKKTMFIEQEEYDKLLYDTVAFTDIFIKGITRK